MKVLVACEYSGIVRDAFTARGHDAWSCDLLPSERPGKHCQGDVMNIDMTAFDLIIAHPPCTRIANSGVRWLAERNLWSELDAAVEFFNYFVRLGESGKKVAIENPIPHKHARIPKYTQIIHPWQFGHGEMKATCIWEYNLPELVPTNIVEGREQRVWKMGPSETRWKERSTTYRGIAHAMATQWG